MRRLRPLTQFRIYDGEGGRRPPSRFPAPAWGSTLAVLLAAVLAGCAHSDGDSEQGAPQPRAAGVVKVVERGDVAASWVVGDRLVGRGGK